MATDSKAAHFLPNLNGLRFFAALSVCVFHCFTLQRENWKNIRSGVFGELCYKIASQGHLGVNLFFVLSGFLITYRLLKEYQETGKINALQFLIRRTLRIWPLYFLIVIFGFYFFPLLPFGFETKHSIVNYSLFLANIDELKIGLHDANNSLTTLWSVSIEEQFYLGLFLIILLFSKRIANVFPILFIAVLFYCWHFRTLHVSDERVLYYHTFSVISDIAIGGLGAVLIQLNTFKAFFERLTSYQLFFLYLVAAILFILTIAINHLEFIPFSQIIQAGCFLMLILEQAFSSKHLFQFDAFPYFAYMGKRTYGFYLFHCILLFYSNQILWSLGLANSLSGFLLHLFLVLTITATFSILSYRFIELPLMRLGHKG